MRGFIGLCLLVTGLLIGAYSHYPDASQREATLVELTHIVTGSIPSGASAGLVRAQPPAPQRDATKPTNLTANGGRWYASPGTLHPKATSVTTVSNVVGRQDLQKATPSSTVATKSAEPILEKLPKLVIRRPVAVDRVAQARMTASARQQVLTNGWQTAVVRVGGNRPSTATRVTSLKPKTSSERLQLVKDLQAQLKRVGCYWGKIDGVWGKGSKYAINKFIERVNATLQTRTPDYFLLQLVAGHQSKICGRSCPRGQQTAASGSCVPNAIIARNNARRSPVKAAGTIRAGGDYRVVAATSVSSPRDAKSQPAKTAARRRPVPLPGRMAVGAARSPAKPAAWVTKTRAVREAAAAKQVGLPWSSDTNRIAQKRLQISALPANADAGPNVATATVADLALETRVPATARRLRQNNVRVPVVVPNRAVTRRRAGLAKKATRKNKKRRYRRYRRRRSVQSMFTHPLGRM